jgi:hypothetical protein
MVRCSRVNRGDAELGVARPTQGACFWTAGARPFLLCGDLLPGLVHGLSPLPLLCFTEGPLAVLAGSGAAASAVHATGAESHVVLVIGAAPVHAPNLRPLGSAASGRML